MRVLDQLQAGDQAALDREYASPIERYREDVLKVGKNINDEMESVAVDGLTLLNNGLADAIANAKSLGDVRSEEHTSELQSLMRISYAVFCLQKKKKNTHLHMNINIMNQR